ncbi:MAG: hypothetical protein GSR72_02535 [Desulfurococcales archaeon]|nr:hypothetical protein [Desulfurococcales archaeon]
MEQVSSLRGEIIFWKHVLRMAGEWSPLEQVKRPTSEFEPRLWVVMIGAATIWA